MEADDTLKVLEWEESTLPYGSELRAVTERLENDGTRKIVKQYSQKIEIGDNYIIINHISLDGGTPQTFIVAGTKGPEVGGEWRIDEVQLTYLKPNGDVTRVPRQTTRVRLGTPAEKEKGNRELFEEALARRPNANCPLRRDDPE